MFFTRNAFCEIYFVKYILQIQGYFPKNQKNYGDFTYFTQTLQLSHKILII